MQRIPNELIVYIYHDADIDTRLAMEKAMPALIHRRHKVVIPECVKDLVLKKLPCVTCLRCVRDPSQLPYPCILRVPRVSPFKLQLLHTVGLGHGPDYCWMDCPDHSCHMLIDLCET